MNYLAHTFLSYGHEEILAGNLMADHVKGKPDSNLPQGILKGIQLHRMIDSYTDNHPVVLHSKKRLYADFGKYAPVVIDIYYDHILAINWSRYHNESLETFSRRNYILMRAQMKWMPTKFKMRLPTMIDHNWLLGYRTVEGIARSFERLKVRASYPEKLDEASRFLSKNINLLKESFNDFFPDVEKMAKEFIQAETDSN